VEEHRVSSVTFRISPQLKDAIQRMATRERRSMSQMIEVMAVRYLESHDEWSDNDARAKPRTTARRR
jgi:predicted transcriptional regulator